jgi:hypothetical protein
LAIETCDQISQLAKPALLLAGRNGASLIPNEQNVSYAIIRHNVRTYRSAGVVAVLKGKHNAESEMKNLEKFQLSQDRLEGWRYFVEQTHQRAGIDAAQATQVRQTELEARETPAQLDADALAARTDPRR